MVGHWRQVFLFCSLLDSSCKLNGKKSLWTNPYTFTWPTCTFRRRFALYLIKRGKSFLVYFNDREKSVRLGFSPNLSFICIWNFILHFLLEIHPLLNVKKPTDKNQQKKVSRTKQGKPSKSEKSKHKYRDEVSRYYSLLVFKTDFL